MSHPIEVRFLPIADGIWREGNDEWVHLCLHALVVPAPGAAGELAVLPEVIESTFKVIARQTDWLRIGGTDVSPERTDAGWRWGSLPNGYIANLWKAAFAGADRLDQLYGKLSAAPLTRELLEDRRVEAVVLERAHSELFKSRSNVFSAFTGFLAGKAISEDGAFEQLSPAFWEKATQIQREKRRDYWKTLHERVNLTRAVDTVDDKNTNPKDAIIRELQSLFWATSHEPAWRSCSGAGLDATADAIDPVAVYGAIRTDPRTATLFGFTINLRVRSSTVFPSGVEECGEIVIRDQAHPLKSSYFYWPAGVGGPKGFQPASRAEIMESLSGRRAFHGDDPDSWRKYCGSSEASGMTLKKGMVDLTDGKFGIRMWDTVRGAAGDDAQVSARELSKKEGDDRDLDGDRFHCLQCPGMELVHAQPDRQIKWRRGHSKRLQLPGIDRSQGDLYLAEDLLAGLRVDIERTGVGPTPVEPLWATAMARKVRHTWGAGTVDDDAWTKGGYRHREEGYIVQVPRKRRETPAGAGHGADAVDVDVVFDSLCTWTGESLGLPSSDSASAFIEEVTKVPGFEGVDVQYQFADDRDGRLPVLRVGHGYRFAARAVFLHGGGPVFHRDEAGKSGSLHDTTALGLGGLQQEGLRKAVSRNRNRAMNNRTPLPFLPVDTVRAPTIAILDTLLGDEASAKQRVDRVVLCSADGREPAPINRILLPPRIAPDVAELQGQFDNIVSNSPPGALPWIELQSDGELPSVILAANSAPVVRQGPHRAKYYCDARARCVTLLLSDGNAEPSKSLIASIVVEFWKSHQTPDDARPVVIRVARKRGNGVAKFEGVNGVYSQAKVINGIPTTEVTVLMDIGDEVHLTMFCHDDAGSPTTPSLFSCNGFIEAAVASLPTATHLGRRNLCVVLGQTPADIIQDRSVMELVSAVRRPSPPTLCSIDGRPGSQVRFVRLSGQPSDLQRNWADQVAGKVPFQSMADGTVGFLAARVEVDYPSTSHLRLEAVWQDFDDAVALSRDTDAQGVATWTHKPAVVRVKFGSEIPVHPLEAVSVGGGQSRDWRRKQLSLVRDELDHLRSIQFKVDTQALLLGMRAIAVSRFQDCFREKGSGQVEGVDAGRGAAEDGEFESANFSIDEFLGMQSDDTRVLVVPATRRPPIPDIIRGKDRGEVEYVFCREEHRCDRGLRVTSRAWWSLRIRLVKGSWFKSGVGELFAVVLPTNEDRERRRAMPAVAVPFGQRGTFRTLMARWFSAAEGDPDGEPRALTWWAAPPDTMGGDVPDITPDCFPRGDACCGGTADQADVSVPESEVKCRIVTYMPVLDSATGERFVDIDVLPPAVDSPFVRLSVARFQPNALQRKSEDSGPPGDIDLRLSGVVDLDPVPLPPSREVTAEWMENGDGTWSLAVSVKGVAYRDRNVVPTLNRPITPEHSETVSHSPEVESDHKLSRPWMCMRVLRPLTLGDGYVMASTSAGRPAEWEGYYCHHDGIVATWEHTFSFDRNPGAVKVFVEEFEKHEVEREAPSLDDAGPTRDESTPRAFKCEIIMSKPE